MLLLWLINGRSTRTFDLISRLETDYKCSCPVLLRSDRSIERKCDCVQKQKLGIFLDPRKFDRFENTSCSFLIFFPAEDFVRCGPGGYLFLRGEEAVVPEKRQWKCNKIKTSAKGKSALRYFKARWFDSIQFQPWNGESSLRHSAKDIASTKREREREMIFLSFVRFANSFPRFHFKVSLKNSWWWFQISFRDPIDFEYTLQHTHTHIKNLLEEIYTNSQQYIQFDPLKDIFQLIIMDL